MTEQIGYTEGDICNRDGCKGTIKLAPTENCTCHISPPCSQCTKDNHYCDTCDWRGIDDE